MEKRKERLIKKENEKKKGTLRRNGKKERKN